MEITGNYRQLPGAIIRYRVIRLRAADRQYTWLAIRASQPANWRYLRKTPRRAARARARLHQSDTESDDDDQSHRRARARA